ncbi:MAG: hypothetical protein AB8G16_14220 [Gammaproteobacteria bacterium]
MIVCCAALLCVAATDPLKVNLPELDEMKGMETSWAAQNMAMNGVPMSIKTFTSRRSAQKVLDFYEREWREAGLSPRLEGYGDYQTLGAGEDNVYFSIQVRDRRGGSEGRITVSRQIASPSRETAFPLPRKTTTVSKIDSLDAGTRAESIVAYAPGSPLQNEQWYRRELARLGWSFDHYANESESAQKVLAFQRDAELCQLTLVPDQPGYRGKTMLLIHWVKGG